MGQAAPFPLGLTLIARTRFYLPPPQVFENNGYGVRDWSHWAKTRLVELLDDTTATGLDGLAKVYFLPDFEDNIQSEVATRLRRGFW